MQLPGRLEECSPSDSIKERDAPIRIDNPMSSSDAEILSGRRDLLGFSLVRIPLFFMYAMFGHLFDDQGGKTCSINAL